MKKELIWWIALLILIAVVRETLSRAGTIDRYGLFGVLLLIIGLLVAFIGASRTVWKKEK